jgi:hypothetical protein
MPGNARNLGSDTLESWTREVVSVLYGEVSL